MVVCLTIWYAMPAAGKSGPVTESLASAFKLSHGAQRGRDKIALSSAAETRASLPFISDELATLISQQGLENALSQPLARILEQVQLALDNAGKNRMSSI